jgi:hypothetical protein
MRALQPLKRSCHPEMQTWYYIFMTGLLDSGHVPQKNFPLNKFRELNRQYMLKHFAREPNALPKLCNYLMPKVSALQNTFGIHA